MLSNGSKTPRYSLNRSRSSGFHSKFQQNKTKQQRKNDETIRQEGIDNLLATNISPTKAPLKIIEDHFPFPKVKSISFQGRVFHTCKSSPYLGGKVNALLGDHLGASRDLTVDTVARIEQSMKRHPVAGSMEFTFQRVHIPLGKATDMFPQRSSLYHHVVKTLIYISYINIYI